MSECPDKVLTVVCERDHTRPDESLSRQSTRRVRLPGGVSMSVLMQPDTASGGSLRDRIAGAPISWGVCEVPGWGYQLPAARVLAEMGSLGLRATELGPEGFLPAAPEEKAALLAEHDLHAVGGFLPLLLHDADHDPMPELDAF